jgi:hypothetical protein
MRILMALVVALLSLTGVSVAFAATGVAEDASLLDLLQPVLAAVKGGQGFLAAALVLVLCVSLARRYAGSRFPWIMSDVGGALLTLLGAFGGAAATALMAGTAPSIGLAVTAFGVAFAASGGYSMVKRLGVPLLRKLQDKAPAWMRPVFGLVLWWFGKPDAVATAEAAGDAAVEATPGPGIEGVTGKPTVFPPAGDK